ncbi:MAG TPA: helix-turn-helix transcriptional regulator [Candidatus Wallbacteria bacterium]|nr:helix-turn-helix transcriptional regulator [Candidatus Wallbacteria bacterium]
MFGEFVKQKRIECELSLREFCRRLNEDASNWSKIERGKLPPPQDIEKIEMISGILNIKKDSQEWNNLLDYARIDAGIIPDYVMKDSELMAVLPLFFRTVDNIKPTREELLKIIEAIKKGK